MTNTKPGSARIAAPTGATAPPPARPLAQVMRIADETITVEDLVNGQQVYTVRPGWQASRAIAELTHHGFTQAPVTDVPIRRYVTINDLRSSTTVDEASRPVPAHMFIAATSPLSFALERLADHPVLFVTHQGHTIGVVTVADLEQPAVSLLVLGMITATETALDELIERASSRRWMDLLDDEARRDVEQIYEDRRRHDADFSQVRCLDLPKRVDLALKLDLTEPLGFPSKTAFKRWKETVVRVRNHLAHGSTILSAVAEPSAALAAISDIRTFATRSWQLVADEDAKVAAFTSATIAMATDPSLQLTGPQAPASLPLPTPAFVITADNPGGLLDDPQVNRRRRQRLEAALDELGVPATAVTAGAGDWYEQSWLISSDDCALETVLQLANDLGQHSIFQLDNDTMKVVRAADGHVLATKPRRGRR